MTTFRSEETLVGLFGVAVIAWTLWTIERGLRHGRLPIGRSYVRRDERAGAFAVLLAFYAGSALLLVFICFDLLFGIRIL